MDRLLADLIGATGPDSTPPDAVTGRPGIRAPSRPQTMLGAEISEGEFATIVGITTRRIRAMVDQGIIERIAPGRYSISEVGKYCNFLREGGGRRVAPTDELKIEKTRQARAAAEKLELQNEALRGDLLPRGEVEREWSNILRDVRAQILAVPSRCGAALAHLTPHDVATIEAEVRSALESLAHDN